MRKKVGAPDIALILILKHDPTVIRPMLSDSFSRNSFRIDMLKIILFHSQIVKNSGIFNLILGYFLRQYHCFTSDFCFKWDENP